MSSLKSKIESLLFITNHPLNYKKIAELTKEDLVKVKEAVETLFAEYESRPDSGVKLLRDGQQLQLVTNGENAKLVKDFIKDETTGELTPASLETLTIIAYRGPITRAELEKIRGVNCSIILRNLMMRGLVEGREDKKKMESLYQVTLDFLKYLSLTQTDQLPDYERLNKSEALQSIIQTPEIQ